MIAHGALLRKNFFSVDQLTAIINDFRNADLPPEEVAMMSFAQKVITQPAQLTETDYDELREHGFSDVEILDIILASTARSFFSKTLDSLNAEPDETYLNLEPELLNLLTIGRPFLQG